MPPRGFTPRVVCLVALPRLGGGVTQPRPPPLPFLKWAADSFRGDDRRIGPWPPLRVGDDGRARSVGHGCKMVTITVGTTPQHVSSTSQLHSSAHTVLDGRVVPRRRFLYLPGGRGERDRRRRKWQYASTCQPRDAQWCWRLLAQLWLWAGLGRGVALIRTVGAHADYPDCPNDGPASVDPGSGMAPQQ